MSAAERRLADLLTLLIEDFEDKHYALKVASPIEVLNELMLANNLKQKGSCGRLWNSPHRLWGA